MKSTRILSVFTTLLISLASYADVVYEPLLVASGFNRDCIAETTSLGSCAWSPLYDLTSVNAHTSCFGTRSVIASINANQGFTEEDYAKTIAGGWPDDNGNPDDRVIRCSTEYLADAYQNPTFADVYWRLAPYDGPNVLTLRPGNPDSDAKGWHASGTLTFQKIGCYDQLFFLMASLRQGSGVGQRKVTTIVHYTDGTTSNQEFLFAGLGGEVGQRVQITNVYESPFKKNTVKDPNNAYVSVFPMDVNPNKLIESIEFTNNITNTSAIIFAVTGRTADIDAPDEELTEVSNITEHSFEACWEAIQEAASYRLDVAEDPDFQHILADYNNKVIEGESTCQEVVNLVSNNDYYWRVRSVNADGGQSASSAPRCARTAGNNPPIAKEDDDDIEGELAPYAGYRAVLTELDINRTLYKDGYFNTICLPFSLATLDGTPLEGGELFEFVSATKNGDQLDLTIEPAASLEAGKPYLIRWPNTGEVLTSLSFYNVNVTTATGQIIGEEDEIRFVGHIGQQQIALGDTHNLFVGENNVLYWPDETDEKMLGFRAYFALPQEINNAPIRRYMPAQLIIRNEYSMPTEVESGKSKAESRKIMENGQLYIIHNGVLYNTVGAKIKEEVKR